MTPGNGSTVDVHEPIAGLTRGTSDLVGVITGSFASHAYVTAIRQLDPIVETIAFSVGQATVLEPSQGDDRPGLDVKVGYDGGFVTATDAATGIFGAGDTLAGAFADLGQALIEHLDVLERQPALSVGLQEQLRYLRQRLVAR